MEEKERFELFGEHCIKDNNPDARPQLLDAYVACVILNEQDKKIKAKEKEANTYAKEIAFLDNRIKQLKQAQNQKAIEELTMFEAILNRAVQWDNDSKCWTISEEVFGNFIVQIDEKIEELRGEE